MSEIPIIDGKSTTSPEPTRESTNFQVNPMPSAIPSGTITQGRSSSGSPIYGGAINGNSIINVGGGETTVKAARAAGLVIANADGSFSMVSAATRAQVQQQKQADQDKARAEAQAEELGEVEIVAPQIEGTISTFANSVSPSTVMGAVLDMSNGVDVRDSHIIHAASEMGIEPTQVRGMVEQVRSAFEAQARATVEKTGLTSDEVFAWANEHKPELMKEAIRHQATQRSTKGYQKIAQAYMENLDTINPEALLSAQLGDGLRVKKANNGRIVVETSKGDIEYRAAIRAGLITVSRAYGPKGNKR
jgi:hypothetical protein